MILQYGSSLFNSETKDSDYDIIILCSKVTLSKYDNGQEKSIRDSFLFGSLFQDL
jgi:predicted nucleotidyltransferase